MTIPDARIEAARRYGEAHGCQVAAADAIKFTERVGLPPMLPDDHYFVISAILNGLVVPVVPEDDRRRAAAEALGVDFGSTQKGAEDGG